MSRNLFSGGDSRLNAQDRARAIKAKLPLLDLVKLRVLLPYPSRDGTNFDCPHCHNAGKAAIVGQGYRCDECGASGDAITLEQAVSGASFKAACYNLERIIEDKAAGAAAAAQDGLFDAPRRRDGVITEAYRDPDNADPYRGQRPAGEVSKW